MKGLLKADKDLLKVPRSVQRSIPIQRIYNDGIWQVGGEGGGMNVPLLGPLLGWSRDKRFSKTWRFSDINYSSASKNDQTDMFLSYCDVLNALPIGAASKITINNRPLNRRAFSEAALMKDAGDGLDHLRHERNALIEASVQEANSITRERYITISAEKKDVAEARSFFTRVGSDLTGHFARLSSQCTELASPERLRILHDFFRTGEEQHFSQDLRAAARRGHDFRDYIAPDALQFKSDHFIVGGKVGRVLFLREYASFIKDTLVSELAEFPRHMMLSIDFAPVPTDDAVREINNRLMAVESDVTRWQQKQNMQNNFSAVVPYDMEQMRKDTKEFLDDLTGRDQRMMFGLFTLVHLADTLEELNTDTESLQSIGRKYLCQFAIMRYQQEDALKTALPYGLRRIEAMRTLTTESGAAIMPFNTQEIMHKGGIFQGINPISKNPIFVDRTILLNPHGFVLGVSGSGKSVTLKDYIFALVMMGIRVFIVDIEGEYTPIVQAAGGEVIKISPSSPHRINIMDVPQGYGGDDSPVVVKAELIMSLLEDEQSRNVLGQKQKSLIDRCVANVYRGYLPSCTGTPPTLVDLYENLLAQPEPEAHELALMLEKDAIGSFSIFAGQSNVDTHSNLVCYDISDAGPELASKANKVVLDFIDKSVTQNNRAGLLTGVICDEAHNYFRSKYSALFFARAWKRYRKKGGIMTAATQNISEILESEMARLMLANSEYLVLLNQAASDRKVLAELLGISDTQLSYITNCPAGHGLLKVGGAIVPFVHVIPQNTELYRLVTTKPGES